MTDRIAALPRATPEPEDAARTDPPNALVAPPPPRFVIRAIAFVVGAASLGAEISAARLLATLR